MRESRDACTWSVLGARFSFFSVRDVKRRRSDSEEGFVVPSRCNSCRIENANFLVLQWFKRE